MSEPIASRTAILISQVNSHLRTPLYRHAYALISSSVAMSVLGMLYWMLAAYYCPPDGVGFNAAAVSAMLFVSDVSQLNMGEALIRFVPRGGRATLKLVGYVYLLAAMVATLIGIVTLSLVGLWSILPGALTARPLIALWFVAAVLAS